MSPIDPDLLELLPGYLEKRQQEFIQVAQWLKENDFEKIERVGHQLKGNASLFGLSMVESLGAQLEKAAQTKDRHEILTITEALKSVVTGGIPGSVK